MERVHRAGDHIRQPPPPYFLLKYGGGSWLLDLKFSGGWSAPWGMEMMCWLRYGGGAGCSTMNPGGAALLQTFCEGFLKEIRIGVDQPSRTFQILGSDMNASTGPGHTVHRSTLSPPSPDHVATQSPLSTRSPRLPRCTVTQPTLPPPSTGHTVAQSARSAPSAHRLITQPNSSMP